MLLLLLLPLRSLLLLLLLLPLRSLLLQLLLLNLHRKKLEGSHSTRRGSERVQVSEELEQELNLLPLVCH